MQPTTQNQQQRQPQTPVSMKTIIERGASWTMEETKLLLSLWGQDLVQRQNTNLKRTKETYDKIAEQFQRNGFERTSDQVRTRVFNMIAEYRRILREPSPERVKKCIFFEALHKIYLAKSADDVEAALADYDEPECPYSPTSNTIMSERGDESVSDSEAGLVIDGDASASRDGTSSSVGLKSTSNNNNNNNNNNNANEHSKDNINISTHKNSDLHDETNGINDNADNSTQNTSTSAASNATATTAATLNKQPISADSNSPNVKHFKIKTSNNEVMLLKVLDGDSMPVNKKLKTNELNKSVAQNTTSTSLLHQDTTNTSQHQHSSKQQSLLLPNSSAFNNNHATTSSATKTAGTAGSSNNAYISINNAKIPIIRSNGDPSAATSNNQHLTSTPTMLKPTTATVTTGHHHHHGQLYQAPVNTYDVTSSALLIDRMFAHLSRESENMREWIALEKERLAFERARKAQEIERETRRERVMIDTLTRFQEQWINFVKCLDPRAAEAASMPKLNDPTTGATTSTAAAATSSPSVTTDGSQQSQLESQKKQQTTTADEEQTKSSPANTTTTVAPTTSNKESLPAAKS